MISTDRHALEQIGYICHTVDCFLYTLIWF